MPVKDIDSIIDEVLREFNSEEKRDRNPSLHSQSMKSPRDIASMIDHTLLRPEATVHDIERLCHEARQYGFASVCINPSYVPLCVRLLHGSSVRVCTVIGFPLGATSTAAKVAEAQQALHDGASELDMVLHIGKLKEKDYQYVEQDITAVVHVAHRHQALVKVILETCLLSEEEKIGACAIAKQAGADFVKTSTGCGKSGATVEDVTLMRRVVGSDMGVKASGGIRSHTEALAMIRAGANRIGASASVKIVSKEEVEL